MIDYTNLSDSIKYFNSIGYKELSLPWHVEKEYIEFTLKKELVNKYKFKILDNRFLVGSAEQSFIKSMIEDKIYGSYQSITPCFRDDVEDNLHHKYFMKNEIFINNDISIHRLQRLIEEVLKLYSKYTTKDNIEIVETSDELSIKSFDININGIEVGSYGIRELEGYGWIYGTGVAEPRFSYSLKKENK